MLYIVPTPIGNYEDITMRALRILKSVDFIICEEFKEARRLLNYYGIDKPLESLNEHNEKQNTSLYISRLKQGEKAALISDCGTPLFSDPGSHLVQLSIQADIPIIPLPGANSLTTALSASGFRFDKFYYYGWLSPKKEIRQQELLKLKPIKSIIVFLETPYRLQRLIADLVEGFGASKPAVLAYQLTYPDEQVYRGTVKELLTIAEQNHLKGEFVFIIDNRK